MSEGRRYTFYFEGGRPYRTLARWSREDVEKHVHANPNIFAAVEEEPDGWRGRDARETDRWVVR